jgi:glycosyltransferase involved in cell wall biosynthesis
LQSVPLEIFTLVLKVQIYKAWTQRQYQYLKSAALKIAMIHTPILGRGGGERQVLRLALELQRRGNEVEIFVSALNVKNSYPEMIKDVRVTVVPHPLGKILPSFLRPREQETAQKEPNASTARKSRLQEYMRHAMGRQFYTIPYELPTMLKIAQKIPKGFDIINPHNYPSEWAAAAAKKRINAAVVWMCNEPPFWFFVPELRRGLRRINAPVYNVVDRTAVNYIDRILVLSHIAAGYVQKAYNRPSRVVRTGVDADQFASVSGVEARKRLGLEKDFIILQTGNIELNKRQVDTVKALQILAKTHSDVRLVFDGGGRRDELSRYIEKQGVTDKIVFTRSNSDKELAGVYAACDAFVFPAQITWGLAVVEAMASARPVIVSERCGASEIIQNGVNGLVVPHADPEGIAERVEFLISNPGMRKEMGEHAQEYVRCNLSWERFAERIEQEFERAKQGYKK